jgi:hypothetical protein
VRLIFVYTFLFLVCRDNQYKSTQMDARQLWPICHVVSYTHIYIYSIAKFSQTYRFNNSKVEKQIMVFVLLFNVSTNSVRSYGVRRGCIQCIGSIGLSLGPHNLGGLRTRCIIFLTLLLDFHTYAVITYCTF